MYGGFTNPKLLGGLSDCGIVINNIVGDADGSLFDIILQKKSPQNTFFTVYEVV